MRAVHSAIRLTDVTKRFDGVTAVDRLTLAVPGESIYGFIGPNGSGKTTTLRMIMHLLLPDEGRIEVLGSADTRAARDRVGYLPEERGLYKKMQVRRLLRYYGRLKGRSIAELDPVIDEWLARLGMAGWGDRKIETLSKGMSQKIQFVAAVLQIGTCHREVSGVDRCYGYEQNPVLPIEKFVRFEAWLRHHQGRSGLNGACRGVWRRALCERCSTGRHDRGHPDRPVRPSLPRILSSASAWWPARWTAR